MLEDTLDSSGRVSSGGKELEDGAGDLGMQLKREGEGGEEIYKKGRKIKGEDIKHLERNRKEERKKTEA